MTYRYEVTPSSRRDWLVVDTKKMVAIAAYPEKEQAEFRCQLRNDADAYAAEKKARKAAAKKERT
jgi:hypothetical protein